MKVAQNAMAGSWFQFKVLRASRLRAILAASPLLVRVHSRTATARPCMATVGEGMNTMNRGTAMAGAVLTTAKTGKGTACGYRTAAGKDTVNRSTAKAGAVMTTA